MYWNIKYIHISLWFKPRLWLKKEKVCLHSFSDSLLSYRAIMPFWSNYLQSVNIGTIPRFARNKIGVLLTVKDSEYIVILQNWTVCIYKKCYTNKHLLFFKVSAFRFFFNFFSNCGSSIVHTTGTKGLFMWRWHKTPTFNTYSDNIKIGKN